MQSVVCQDLEKFRAHSIFGGLVSVVFVFCWVYDPWPGVGAGAGAGGGGA